MHIILRSYWLSALQYAARQIDYPRLAA